MILHVLVGQEGRISALGWVSIRNFLFGGPAVGVSGMGTVFHLREILIMFLLFVASLKEGH